MTQSAEGTKESIKRVSEQGFFVHGSFATVVPACVRALGRTRFCLRKVILRDNLNLVIVGARR